MSNPCDILQSDDTPEFVLVNTKEPEPDPKDPSKLVHTEDPLILHTPTGRLINYVDDEKHGIRLFWQPEDGVVDPEKVEFLRDGFDEFYGIDTGEKKETAWTRFISGIENAFKPFFDKIQKWAEQQKEASELRMQVIEKELELAEAELCLEEAIEEMDEELKRREKEEEKKVEMGLEETEDTTPSAKQDEKVSVEEEEDEEEEEDGDDDDDDDDDAPSSFGSANKDQEPSKNDQKGSKPRPSPFSTSSLSFATRSLVSGVSKFLCCCTLIPSSPPPLFFWVYLSFYL